MARGTYGEGHVHLTSNPSNLKKYRTVRPRNWFFEDRPLLQAVLCAAIFAQVEFSQDETNFGLPRDHSKNCCKIWYANWDFLGFLTKIFWLDFSFVSVVKKCDFLPSAKGLMVGTVLAETTNDSSDRFILLFFLVVLHIFQTKCTRKIKFMSFLFSII